MGVSLYSRNTRSQTPLVGCAHVGNRPSRLAMTPNRRRDHRDRAVILSRRLQLGVLGNPELSLLELEMWQTQKGGIASLVERTKLHRDNLYRMLLEGGDSEFLGLDASCRWRDI